MTQRSNAVLGKECVDRALQKLGQSPLAMNPSFAADVVAGREVFTLLTPDAAPLRFEFGYELEVGLGPFSEVFVGIPDHDNGLEEVIRRLLTSAVRVDQRRRSGLVEFIDPSDGAAWLTVRRRTLWGSYRPAVILEPRYPPAFAGADQGDS